MLEIEFVNSQAAAREIWVAAKSRGCYFGGDRRCWVNTRDRTELFAALSAYVTGRWGNQ